MKSDTFGMVFADVKWVLAYKPFNATTKCRHKDCTHSATRIVARGPNLRLNNLRECGACLCRTWESWDSVTRRTVKLGWMELDRSKPVGAAA